MSICVKYTAIKIGKFNLTDLDMFVRDVEPNIWYNKVLPFPSAICWGFPPIGFEICVWGENVILFPFGLKNTLSLNNF